MNPDILTQIRENLARWQEMEVAAKVGVAYPDTELDTVDFGSMSAAEFCHLSLRACQHLSIVLDSDVAKFLPEAFQFENFATPTQTQNYRLTQQLAQYINHVDAASWTGAADNLRALIAYQITHGFWAQGEKKLHHPGRERLMELVGELEGRLAQLGESQRAVISSIASDNKRRAELESEFEALQSDASTKVGEITKMTSDVSTLVESKTNEVEELLESATTQDTAIQKIAGDCETTLTEARENLKSLEDKEEVFTAEVTQSRNLLKKATESHSFIESKREEIVDLTGKAAGGALGGKFETRRRRQAFSAGWWLFGVITITLATAAWIYFVSTNEIFQNATLDAWQAFAWKFGLISPAAFLLGYAAKQYGKERNLEEEYAYRAVVAMTLNAFADQIDDCDEKPDRCKLISDTIEKLYQIPQAIGGKTEKESKNDSVNDILSALKDLKGVIGQ